MNGRSASLLGLLLFTATLRADTPPQTVIVDPPTVRLSGPQASHSLLVHGKSADGQITDLTHTARYTAAEPRIAEVSERGVVRSVGDGATTITVSAGGQSIRVPVDVSGSRQPRQFHFENDVTPLLSRFGCNASGCHGKAEGQNGFKLSVFGFDPLADHVALVRESRGRRIFASAPDHSLLLTKMSGRVPHGGGVRISAGTPEYETIRGWIEAGAPLGDPAAPRVASIRVEPRERVLAMRGRQQLRVLARWSDGREADVTRHARFQSNNEGLASVSSDGLITAGDAPGDVAVMAAFMNAVDVARVLIPRSERIEHYPELAASNFTDTLVYRKLRKLQVLPSEPASDADFLRRVYLDVIGALPTAAEVRRFLSDTRSDRRSLLVDELLARPEFADYWALKWSDLLRVDRQTLGHKRAYAYYKWLRDSFAANKPLDQLARELLTAEGPVQESPAAGFFKVVPKPGEAASTLSQVLLGVRIACAECHHHPFDRWSQTDYQGMVAYFSQVSFKATAQGEALVTAGDPQAKHPRTGEVIHAHALGTKMTTASPAGDRRQALAEWLASPENPWFARSLANRAWAHFLGRGLVEPVDDFRDTNPPTNPELLDALAKHLAESKFDFRQLIRTITASRVYQASSRPNATNERDEQNYSRALFKRLDAEVLLDMVCQATGVGERFAASPPGTRAVQLWDSKASHYFLKLFGRPARATACECERVSEPGVSQVLHLMNAPAVEAKLGHEHGTVARLVREKSDDAALVDELYLTFCSRFPSGQERTVGVDYLRKHAARRRQAAEDLAWGLLNSLEFVFNH